MKRKEKLSEIHFQVDGTPDYIQGVIQEIAILAEDYNCSFQMGCFSENGRKFKVVGFDEDLKKLQAVISEAGLPKGTYWSYEELSMND